MQQAIERNADQSLADGQKMMAHIFRKFLVQFGFQVTFCPNEMIQYCTQQKEVPADGRTMFMTSLKGIQCLKRR